MPYDRRSYSGNATNSATLAADITAVSTTFTVSDATGFPTGPNDFHVTINTGGATEEKIKIDSRSGTTFTVASGGRGADGTAAAAHVTGETVKHTITAVDLDEANAHIADTALDHHTSYLNTTRHDVTARHAFAAALGTPAAATTSAPGDTASAGTGAVPAREDHRHGRAEGGLALIREEILAAAGTAFPSITIPAGYRDIVFRVTTRNDATLGELRLQFNGDTGTNYDWQTVTGSESSTPTSAVGAGVAFINLPDPANPTTSAGRVAICEGVVGDYARTQWHKAVTFSGFRPAGTGSRHTVVGGGIWLNTAAITSMRVFCSQNLAIGCILTVWGRGSS